MEIPETHQASSSDSGTNSGRVYKDFLLPISSSSSINDTTNVVSSASTTSYLKCLLISDGSCDKGAAAMSVKVGQMHDPVDGHGIAHLTEHMLFMGSKQYPEENEYDTYLSNNGGYNNAYTDLELTNYYFECSNKSLDGALSRFSSGFCSPLLQTKTIEKEINAVDSEHGKNKQQDSWRIHQLTRTIFGQYLNNNNNTNTTTTTNPHPYGSFGTGNKQSLLECTTGAVATTDDNNKNDGKIDDETMLISSSIKEEQIQNLQTKVQTFYNRYYKAENMALVVMGNQSIELLEEMVRNYFSHLPTITNPEYNIPKLHVPQLLVSLQQQSEIEEEEKSTISTNEDNNNNNNKNQSLPIIIEVVPIRKESQFIEFQWIVPEQLTRYQEKPLHYFSHLVGHEGPGSLLMTLRNLQYAHELYADDGSKSTSTFCIFTIHIELTNLGLQNIQTIVQMVLYYIETIMKDIPSWVYDELKIMGDTQFRFLSKQGSADTVSTLSSQMQYYIPQHYLSGPYKIYNESYNNDHINEMWKYISNIHNLMIIVSSIQYDGKTNCIDPWYGTNYKIVTTSPADEDHDLLLTLLEHNNKNNNNNATKLDPNIIAQLKLPDQNDMLPSNFDLILATEQEGFTASATTTSDNEIIPSFVIPPKCIIKTDLCRLWYKPDTSSFNTPKVNVLVFLRTANAGSSIQQTVLTALYTELITELCNEFAYAASMAGLHCGFTSSTSKHTSGIEIHVSGYNHKVNTLLNRICTTITQELPKHIMIGDETCNALFERLRDKLLESFASILVGQPYQYGGYAADLCLEDGCSTWTIPDRMQYLQEEVTIEDFAYFAKTILSRFEIEVLVHGNVTSKDAIEYTNIFLNSLQPKPPLYNIPTRVVQLPVGKECIYRFRGYNEENDNSCIINRYQIGPVDTKTNAVLSLLNQLINEPAFNTLRTEQQLGYIVFTGIKTNGDDVKSFMMLIQSDTYDPIYMNERIEEFLFLFRTKLVAMSVDEYQSNVDAICETLLQKNQNLTEESSKHWNVISDQTYRFQRLQEIAMSAKVLSKDDVLRILDQYILADSSIRRKLSVQIFGKNHPLPAVEENIVQPTNGGEVLLIDDPAEFVRTQTLYMCAPQSKIVALALLTTTTTNNSTSSDIPNEQ